MSPFVFPDPSVQDTVTNPDTGDVWVFVDNVWMIADLDNSNNNTNPGNPTPPTDNSDVITALRAEMEVLRNDIIGLKAQLQTASLNNFLILE